MYILDFYIPWVELIRRTKGWGLEKRGFLIVDGHSSRVNEVIMRALAEHNIDFVCMPGVVDVENIFPFNIIMIKNTVYFIF